jgi:hypothetical protein
MGQITRDQSDWRCEKRGQLPSRGREPKGPFQLPINSQYPFPRVPEGSFECHSCLVMNYIANAWHAHNPTVEGSNPSPATKFFNQLREFLSVPQTPVNSQQRK